MESRYEILCELGRGGTSVVYKAHDKTLLRDVALKVLLYERPDGTNVKRLQREAQALSDVHHENILHIYSFDINSQGKPTLVMDYVDGKSLSELIKEKGRLSEEEALPIFRGILHGLQHAHELGIIHRDLKPSNILVTTDGIAKIVDFGLVKFTTDSGKHRSLQALTQDGQVFGTPAYMSPEQLSGQADHRSDIYSFGCLMYETLAGEVPFAGQSALEIAAKSLSEEPPTLRLQKVSPKMRAIVRRAMDRDVTKRYQSCREVLEDFDRDDVSDTRIPKSTRVATKYGAAITLGVLTTAALTAGAFVIVQRNHALPPPSQPPLSLAEVIQLDEVQKHPFRPTIERYLPLADKVGYKDPNAALLYIYYAHSLHHSSHELRVESIRNLDKALALLRQAELEHLEKTNAEFTHFTCLAYDDKTSLMDVDQQPFSKQVPVLLEAVKYNNNSYRSSFIGKLLGIYLAQGDVESAKKLTEKYVDLPEEAFWWAIRNMYVHIEYADTLSDAGAKYAKWLDKRGNHDLAKIMRTRLALTD